MSSCSKKIYGNFIILSPNGDFLCRCNEEKVDWYLGRNLAEKIDENTIKLKFEPKGNGKKDDPFYSQERKNECCICGGSDDLSKHHVVPYCFRKHFPKEIKAHSSHDILPICRSCHDIYEKHAYKFKIELSKKYNCSMRGRWIVIDEKSNEIKKSAIKILKNDIPKKEKKKCKKIIQKYIGKKEITQEDLKKVLKIKTEVKSDGFVEYGQFIVNSVNPLEDFIITWRKHFISTMKPQFLPEYWDVNRKTGIR